MLDSFATDGSTEVDGNQDACEVTFAAAGELFYFFGVVSSKLYSATFAAGELGLGVVSSQLCKKVSSQLCPARD